MENDNKQSNEIQVELSEEMAQGTYANLAIISHSTIIGKTNSTFFQNEKYKNNFVV